MQGSLVLSQAGNIISLAVLVVEFHQRAHIGEFGIFLHALPLYY